MSSMILVHIFLYVLDNNTKEDFRQSNNVKIRSQRCLIAKGKLILGFLAHAREENVPSTAMSSIWKSTN